VTACPALEALYRSAGSAAARLEVRDIVREELEKVGIAG